jgi:hypothetical protein
MTPESRPYAAGVALGILLCGAEVASTIWFPSMWNDQNLWLVRLLFFTAGLFFVLVSSNWRYRACLRFWITIAILGMVHGLLILGLIDKLHQTKARILIPLLFVETFVGLLVLNLVLRGVNEEIT